MNKLQTELQLPAYTGLTDQECLDLLQAKTITVKQPIASKDIQKYMALNNKLLPLEASQEPAAISGVRMLELFADFHVDEPAVETALIATLDSLVLANLIIAGDKTALLAMGEKLISRAEQLGLGRLGLGIVGESR